MRSGSSAQDGGGWASDPYEGSSGRREAQFGPEISWPHGFRQLDPQSREVLESAYGTGPTYQPPAMDDYGDPGYSDPSYDGPRTSYAGSGIPGAPGAPVFPGAADYRQPEARVPGYHVPDVRDSRPGYAGGGYPSSGQAGGGYQGSGQASPGYPGSGYQPRDFPAPSADLYPVTGAQEMLRDTNPQPAYPEPRYDNPRLTDRGQHLSDQRSPDPRLEGMRYDELRYEEGPVSAAGPGFDDSVEDESWYAELRRNGPAFPADFREEPRPAGRRPEPQGPSFGSQPGYPQSPAPGGFPGYGQARDHRGRPGPQLNADRGPRTSGPDAAARPRGPANRQPGTVAQGFFGAPTAPVGLLTPPAGHRIEALPDNDPAVTSLDLDTSQFRTLPGAGRQSAGRQGSTAVRPGHGLDGPEITSSWPVQVPAEDADRFAEFWQEDDEEVDYKGLFGDRVTDPDGTKAAKRRIGRRRSGSNDHRLWLGLGGVVIIAAAAITGIIKFEFPSHSGPAHVMVPPARIGSYARTVDLERQTNVAQLRDDVIKMSSGQASHVVTAVYESGNAAGGNTEQIIMFIGGHLANAAPATSVTSFMQRFPGAHVVNAGSLGGKAACVEEAGGTSDSVSMCAWFDNDSFGEIVSPTMNATNLAAAMTTVRPAVEQVAKK